jgi:3-methyladenine DNA glycosylase AlkD
MQAYMKTDMPFYGVQKAGRTGILRDLVRDFRPDSADGYRDLVLALWNLDHREEKYIALGVARHFKDHTTPTQLDLYHRLITEGAWWDLVDEVATHLMRDLVVGSPVESWPVVDRWIDDDDMWLRRTALLCQVGAKDDTDPGRLFAFCASRAYEEEFFIRKAIGWALREYARTDPVAVAAFINAHLGDLSGLSYREGSKHIGQLVDPR